MITLDTFDRKLLDLVQQDARLTHAALGERVGLSPSSVRRRLDALRHRGVIRREVALLDPAAAGAAITVIVNVAFAAESLDADRAFRRRMAALPEVMQCYSVAGQFDFVLVVSAVDPAAYEAWGERELMSDPKIRRYDSYVVWSTVKFTTHVPLAAGPCHDTAQAP